MPEDQLAPVIPLFGGAEAPPQWRSTWVDDEDEDDPPDDGYDECAAIEREIAEKNLLKRLRTRQLSVVEARAVVAERDLDADAIESLLDTFRRRGYLDDAALAEQLIHTGVERKGQGRQALGIALAKRGIPRDVAEAALATLADDDADRALEYARSKARSLSSVERDAALRRLAGQLARRGYPASVAFTAARTALDEVAGPTHGVAFR